MRILRKRRPVFIKAARGRKMAMYFKTSGHGMFFVRFFYILKCSGGGALLRSSL